MNLLWIHPAAEEEVEQAADFYGAESAKLAAAFAREVEEAFARIRELPLAGSLDEAGVRRRYLRRFPFTIFYEVTESQIVVWAVAHQRRRPAGPIRILQRLGHRSRREPEGSPTPSLVAAVSRVSMRRKVR